ncbi:Uncharacterised protein [Serratia marcescens]|nr:Uncharacterised protein [Serratia marcescens]CAI0977610.1 Uncharacterised protein [Serratia marcescens]
MVIGSKGFLGGGEPRYSGEKYLSKLKSLNSTFQL